MQCIDILRMSGQNLLRRKSRTILTVLGVVVGCCSIVIMMSLGAGINEQNERLLKSLGDLSIITVYPGTGSTGSTTGSTGEQHEKLNDATLESFRSLPHVVGVSPLVELPYTADATAVSGRYVAQYVSVMGVDTAQLDQLGYELLDGHAPTKKGEVLLGQYAAYNFADKYRPEGSNRRMPAAWSGGMTCDASGNCREVEAKDEDPFFNPLTTPISLITGATYAGMGQSGMGGGAASPQSDTQTFDLTPVGVLKEDFNKGYATSSGIIMSITDMKALIAKIDPATAKKSADYTQVMVKTDDLKDVPQVEEQIKAMGFNTSSYEQIRQSIEEQSRGIQLALGGIGAVAFLVAAIGIANTMVMSVTERTREIGIMKALGCHIRDIRAVFLGEAVAIGLIGGLIGCTISGLVSWAINVIALGGPSGDSLWTSIIGGEDVARISVIPWWLFIAAVVFSMTVGLIAGFGPANKAVRIPALDAIKNEQ